MHFKVDNSAVVKITKDFEMMHRSAFPVAVRNTLNSAAFDVKKTTMPKYAESNFEKRQANFFKANSRVNMARGFSLTSMQSEIGFIPFSGNNKAVDDLEQQEEGGRIKGRSFIPLEAARSGGSWNKNVRRNMRISGINNIKNAKNAKGKNKSQKLVSSIHSVGQGGFVLSGNVMFQVRRLSGRKFTLSRVYAFKKSRSVNVKATHFMREASIESAEKMEKFFSVEAEKQFKRNFRR